MKGLNVDGSIARRAWLILSLVVLVTLIGAVAANVLLVQLGDWENHRGELTLALRVIWVVWGLVAASILLTRVTVFGWSFRRYFRWDGEGDPPPGAPRPIKAPWYKSAAASFGFTVAIVSITGVAVLITATLSLLLDPFQSKVYGLVIRIVWGSWWVLLITLVLIRVTIFGLQRRDAVKSE
ncbi:MAG: hypothetical protein SNJ75_07070 [Gemmataceae bacterium]